MSFLVRSNILHDYCLFAFIHNEAAKASWISGFAGSTVASTSIHNGAILESDQNMSPFFVTLPTTSSFGDDPSRGRFRLLEQVGAVRTDVTDENVSKLCTVNICKNPL